MNWDAYLQKFAAILNSKNPPEPYDNADYLDYTKLNNARMKRWLKTAVLSEETKQVIKNIAQSQEWIVITEPWCGDAAHITPILFLMSVLNEKIKFTIQLRDSDSEIDNYLTNGGKAIPILIVRNEHGKDIFHWGPRPKKAQQLFLELQEKKAPFEEVKEALQVFYNEDKAIRIQEEITTLLKAI